MLKVIRLGLPFLDMAALCGGMRKMGEVAEGKPDAPRKHQRVTLCQREDITRIFTGHMTKHGRLLKERRRSHVHEGVRDGPLERPTG